MLAFRGVTRRFGASLALDDVSFEVPRGQLVALAGPNGAGKTTALRLAATLDRPTAGAIEIAGIDAQGDGVAARRHVAWLGDDPGLHGDLTLRESLRFQAAFFGREREVEIAARAFGIADRLGVRARRLSRGERQRGALARAFLGGELLLLDEPTAALDAEGARDAIDALLDARGARTILAATHDEELLKRADLVLRLEGGRLA